MMISRSSIIETLLLFGALLLISPSMANADPLRQFVCETYENGAVPFDHARSFGSDPHSVKDLEEFLREPDMLHCWSNTAMTLGALGTSDAVDSLKTFILEGDKKLSGPEFRSKGSAILALGWAANTEGRPQGSALASKEALAFLEDSIREDNRNPLKRIKWQWPLHSPNELQQYLIVRAYQALALSGSDDARKAITDSPRCKATTVSDSPCAEYLGLIDTAHAGLGKIYP